MANLIEFGFDEEDLTKKANILIKNLIWFEKNKEILREKYADKYIAIINEEVLDSDQELHKLKERIKKRGISLNQILIEFIHPKDVVLIL